MSDDIIHFQKKGEVILQGDINARTGSEEDSLQPDKFEQETEVGDNLELPPRNSEDKGHIDIRGGRIT